LPEPQAFADRITADHKILNEDDASRSEDRNVLIVQDAFTKWLQAYPVKTKSADDAKSSIKRFLGPQQSAKHAYSDNFKELIKAFKDLQIDHDTSTPNRSETNGVVERAVRRVKEGASAALVQPGLSEDWWDVAVTCYCFLRVINDLLVEDKTSWEKRFGEVFQGPRIPLGAGCTYKPSSEKDQARLHQLGAKMLAGIFVGYSQHSGGGWNGDLLIVDQQ